MIVTDTARLTLTLPSDLEIRMSREFDAPRRLVFDAYTRPELLRRWLGVRNGWTFESCEVDLRVGGRYRWVWAKGDQRLGIGGTFLEVAAPERLVSTEHFEEPFAQGEAHITITFTEAGGRTTLTITSRAPTKEIRDAVLKSGMADGVSESFDNLAEVLAGGRA